MFTKQSKGVNQIETLSEEQVSNLVDEKVLNRMTKLAKNIRSISPKSDDFVYFSIIFLRAAEAALLDESGNIKKVGSEDAWGYFDENYKWRGNVLPHRNNNSDIFPEAELKKASSKWIGLPLCRDHESSSVDGVRGIILDTYYDEKFKQVVGLCALDKVNYPDLARKVQTGVIRYGSMGTAVENSICSECQNIARTPQEYCHHVIQRTAHGEVNVGLRPIEYSLVVTPAEPGAVLLKCIASLKSYSNEFHNYGVKDVDDMLGKLNEKQAVHLNTIMKTACGPEGCSIEKRDSIVRSFLNNNGLIKEAGDYKPVENSETSSYSSGKMQDSIANEIASNKLEDLNNSSDSGVNLNYEPSTEPLTTITAGSKRSTYLKNTIKNILEERKMNKERLNKRANMRRKIAYHQGGAEGVEPNTYKSEPFSYDHDKQMHQEFSGGDTGMVSGDKETKEKLLRASLRERALNRRKVAYHQGGSEGVEPSTYKSEPFSYDHDKQMHQEFSGGDTGMISGDKETKEKLHRANFSGRGISKTAKYSGPALRTKLLVRKVAGKVDRANSVFQVFAGDTKVFESRAGEIFGSELNSNWDWMTSRDYGQEVCRHIRANGLNKTISILKNAQEEPAPAPELEMEELDLSAEEVPAAPEAPAMEEPPAMEEAMTEEEEGDSERAMGLLTNMEADISELKDLIKDIEESSPKKSVTFNVDVGDEGAEVEEEVENLDALASDIIGQLKTALAELDDSADEIAMVSSTFDNIAKLSRKDRASFNKLAKEAIADGYKLLGESTSLKKIASKVTNLVKTSQIHEHGDMAHDHDGGDMAHDHASNDISDEDILSALNEADDMSNSAEMQELEKAAIDLRRERREMLLKRAEAKFQKLASKKVAMEMSGMAKDEDDAKDHEEDHAKDQEDHAKDKMEHDADYAKDHTENAAETDEAYYANDKMASIKQQLSDKFQAKKASDERENYKIKLRRAYDVALNMQKKGLLAGTRTALDKQVDEIMMFDDRAFESFKRTIANTKSVGTVKVASSLGGVNVGIKEDVAPKSEKLTTDLLTMMWDK